VYFNTIIATFSLVPSNIGALEAGWGALLWDDIFESLTIFKEAIWGDLVRDDFAQNMHKYEATMIHCHCRN